MIKESQYELHHDVRGKKRGGGVAIMYKKHLAVKEGCASCSQYLSFEYAYIFITFHSNRRIVLAFVYRKQEVPFNSFCDEIQVFLEKIMFKGDALLLVGDFNVWVDVEDDINAKHMRTVMNALGLNQQVVGPTHRGGHKLDQIYVNEFQLDIKHLVMKETSESEATYEAMLNRLPKDFSPDHFDAAKIYANTISVIN